MEVNREEAERCCEIAAEAIKSKNWVRAERLIKKANLLYPTKKDKQLLIILRLSQQREYEQQEQQRKQQQEQQQEESRKQSQNQSNNNNSKKPVSPSRLPNNNLSPRSSRTTSPVRYTPEQLEMVSKILATPKSFYRVLGVSRESTDTVIKKSYKKLALQLHPDKNHAPGADEAFKIIGSAVAILTDPQKRKQYNLYCDDENHSRQTHKSQQHFQFNTNNSHYDYDRSNFENAEEFINMFFTAGTFPRNVNANDANNAGGNRRHQQRHETVQQPGLAVGLICLLVLISCMSSFLTSDPVYSLAESSRYPTLRKTNHLQIPYYVKENFDSNYQGSLPRLENSVEEDYITTMKHACFRERGYRELMIVRAKNFGGQIHLDQAMNLKTASCDTLRRLGLTLTKFF